MVAPCIAKRVAISGNVSHTCMIFHQVARTAVARVQAVATRMPRRIVRTARLIVVRRVVVAPRGRVMGRWQITRRIVVIAPRGVPRVMTTMMSRRPRR